MTSIERIGRYPVLGEIGRGGMGVVYRAQDLDLDRPVAIKVLSEVWTDNEEHASRFEREARTLARFNHPNIATIYGVGSTDAGQRFLVLELIEGESLASRLARGVPPFPETLSIAAQMAAALDAAHRREVIHRDLKPDNVLLDLEGRVKVLDFGLAKSLSSGPRAPRVKSVGTDTDTIQVHREFATEPGLVAGTPSYMSPEQIRGSELTAASDLFSFGCVLYECLTGRRVFQADNLGDSIASTLTLEPDWELLPNEVPEAIVGLLRRCLDKDATERPKNAATLAEVLEAAQHGTTSVRLTQQANRVPTNLPSRASSFVGRAKELAQASALLAKTRLLTFTGSGGSGKTRLAVELAEQSSSRYPDGVWLVSLAEVVDGTQVAAALREALSIREQAHVSDLEVVVGSLAEHGALLVFDNCEHVLSDCARVAEAILERCPAVEILATSREGLGISGETTFVVPSLSFAVTAGNSNVDALAELDAVNLFVDRARSARPGFRLDEDNAAFVADICRRLDGIPLAIELAAARVRAMAPEQVAKRLEQSFRILTGGSRAALPRQQTVRATFDWSYELLSEPERQLLRRLSVFAGGCTLESAEIVAADPDDADGAIADWEVLDLITALVEKSLVQYDETTDRYRLLETAREFGREELAKEPDGATVRSRHVAFFLELAETAAPHLVAADQVEWMNRLDAEVENLRAALDWCDAAGECHSALKIVASVWRFWNVRGHARIGLESVRRALDGCPKRDRARAEALSGAGVLARQLGDTSSARQFQADSLTVAEEIGDTPARAQAHYSLAILGLFDPRESIEPAREHLQHALELFRENDDMRGIANVLNSLGWIAQSEGALDQATTRYEEALALRRRIGELNGVAMALGSLGLVARDRGDLARSRQLLEESLALLTQLDAKTGIGWMLENLGMLERSEGNFAVAIERMKNSLVMRRQADNDRGVATSLLGLVDITLQDPNATAESRLATRTPLSEALSIVEKHGIPFDTTGALETTARFLFHLGDLRGATILAERAAVSRADLRGPSLDDPFHDNQEIRAAAVKTFGEDEATRLAEEARQRPLADALSLAVRLVTGAAGNR